MTQKIQKGTLEHAALTDPKAAEQLEARAAYFAQHAQKLFEDEQRQDSRAAASEMLDAIVELREARKAAGLPDFTIGQGGSLRERFEAYMTTAMIDMTERLDGKKIAPLGLEAWPAPRYAAE